MIKSSWTREPTQPFPMCRVSRRPSRARSFLKERGIPGHQIQLVWDAIALHTTRSIALRKESEVATTHSGIAVDVIGAALDLIPQDRVRAILAEFPRLLLDTSPTVSIGRFSEMW